MQKSVQGAQREFRQSDTQAKRKTVHRSYKKEEKAIHHCQGTTRYALIQKEPQKGLEAG